MKSFIKKLNNRYVLAVFGMAMLVSAFTAGAVPAFSDSCSGVVPTAPVFNYWPLTYNSNSVCMDLPLIDARDLNAPAGSRDNTYSVSQAQHDAGINANVGDQVRVSIYFHNGATDEASYRSQTTADNVQVGSTYSVNASSVHTIEGSLSADNAATVTSESNHQGGDITINTSTPTTLQYVSGSTQMCIQYAAAVQRGADLSQTCGTDASGQPKILINLPDGIANGTVGIGNLESCFPYSGEVVYTVNIVAAQVAPSNGTLSITKQVEDLTSNSNSGFSSSVTANQGDSVEYQVIVTNTSNVTLNNVAVNDPGTNGTSFNNGNSESTNIGTLSPGQSHTVDYYAKVTASSGSYTNTATASASNAPSESASAVVNVNQVIVPPSNGTLSITKQVEDLTSNSNSGFSSSVTANQGDSVEYQVVVKNISNVTLNNVTVNDPGTNGTSFNNGNSESTNIGTLSAGQSHTVDYDATVTASSGTFVNTATASASNAPSESASATVCVNQVIVPPSNGSLSITKQVEDISSNSGFSSSVTANQGDSVQYKIVVTDTSNVTLNNVVVNDPVISGIQFSGGSNEQFNIGTMTPGQSVTEYVNAQVVASSGTLTNTATASASNAPSQSASAAVCVNQNQIVVPNNGQLSITKNVRDITYSNGNGFAKSTTAFSGDQVQYQIVVTNTGDVALNNVIVSDNLPYGDTYVSGTVDNGNYANSGIQSLGSMYVGQSHTVTINAIVNGNAGQQIQNTATASATNAPIVSDSALVYIGGNPVIPPIVPITPITTTSFTYSKSAFNDTKNVDATTVPADKDDYITYTLTATNTGNTLATNFVFTDDLTNVLNYASMVELNGGTLNGNTITWPAVTIAQNTSVKETFEVRVNYNLPTSYNNLQMVNTYGNTVTIQINNPQVITPVITAPTTGPVDAAAFALGFAGLLTVAFHFIRKAILARKSA